MVERELIERMEAAIKKRPPQPGAHAYQVRDEGYAFVLQVIPEWRVLEIRGPEGNAPIEGALKEWRGIQP